MIIPVFWSWEYIQTYPLIAGSNTVRGNISLCNTFGREDFDISDCKIFRNSKERLAKRYFGMLGSARYLVN